MSPTTHRSNPIGVHAQLWGLGWEPATAERAVRSSAEAGFDLIEIPAPPVGGDRFDATARLLAEHGIGASVSLALPASADISSDDDDAVGQGCEMLLHAVGLAAAVGADYVGGVTYAKMALSTRPVTSTGRRNAQRTLETVAEAAARHGVTVGLECINRYETNLLNTTAQAADFIDEIGAPNLAVHLDTYHANVEERDMRDAVLGARGRLAYIHASENHRGVLGTGSIDWTVLFAALAEVDYTGPITVETFSNAVLDAPTSGELGLWRTLWTDPTVAADEARRFIEVHLAANRADVRTTEPATLDLVDR